MQISGKSPFLKTMKEVKQQLNSDPDLVFNCNFQGLTVVRYACLLKKGLTQKCAGLKKKKLCQISVPVNLLCVWILPLTVHPEGVFC